MASPETREFLKLSRERLRSSSEHTGDTPIQIFESPSWSSSQRSVPRSPGTASLDEHIRVICADGEELLVPRVVALRSGCIRHMLEEGVGTYRERLKRVINLPDLRLETLERIVQFCMMDVLLNKRTRGARRALFRSADDVEDEPMSPLGSPLRSSIPASSSPMSPPQRRAEQAIAFCFALPHDTVMELLAAAHFLDIPELLSTACKMVADNIDDVDTLDGLPADAVMQILEQLPADKLAAFETENKYADMPDTTHLWRVLFHERGLRADEWLHQCSWSARARALGRSLPPDQPQAEQWRSSVLHHILQTALDGYVPSAHPALMALAKHGAAHLKAASLQPQLLDEGLLLPLVQSLPNLQFLDLSACTELEPHLPLLVEMVSCKNPALPAIIGLRLADCALSDAHLAPLVSPVPPRLELLDVSGNHLTTASLPALAALFTGPLTHLSVAGHRFDQADLGRFFAAALLAPKLKLLDLGDTPCVVPSLSEEQWARVRNSSPLEQLFLNDTLVTERAMDAFSTLCAHLPPRLDHLSLRSTGLRAAHLQILSQHAAVESLVSLDIADNYLNRDTAPFLEALLQKSTNLTSLDVSINSLGEPGARALAHALALPTCALRRLNATGTELRAGAVDVAGAAVRAQCRLVWLAMDAPAQISARLNTLFAQRPQLSVLV